MSDHELLEILREELSEHTRLKLVIQTGITLEFGKLCEFRICGYGRYNCMLLIIIMVEDCLTIRTKPNKSSYFDNTIRIPLCDPEMFNRTIAVIKELERTENATNKHMINTMNNYRLLEVLREELSKHTHIDLVIKTVLIAEFDKLTEFAIYGFGRYNCMLLIIIIVDDSLIIRTNPCNLCHFNDIRIPLCDPEMFNRVIAVIEQLESTESTDWKVT